MMIGEYPCCNGNLWLSMPERTPAYLPEDCPHCGAKVWHRFSRVEPMSWTEADFLTEHDVDAETRQIKAKPGTEAEAFDQMQHDPKLIAAFEKMHLNSVYPAAGAVEMLPVDPDAAAKMAEITEFGRQLLEQISKACGVTYEQLSADLDSVTRH